MKKCFNKIKKLQKNLKGKQQQRKKTRRTHALFGQKKDSPRILILLLLKLLRLFLYKK